MSLLLGRRVWIISLTYCLFFSCSIKTGDNEVSGLVQPKNQIQSTFFKDTFSLRTSTVLYNKVSSGISKRLLVGRYVDNVFGIVNANAYAQFIQNQTFYTFGPNPVLDSIVLLAYVGATIPGTNTMIIPYKYGEIDGFPMQISIYRLSTTIADTAYTTSSAAPLYSHKLGELRINGIPSDSRIPYKVVLDPLLGQEFIDNVENFSSVETFQNMFKGLALVNERTTARAVIGIEDMKIRLYYHNYFALNNLKVGDSLDLYLNDALGLPIRKFTRLTTDRTGSVLSDLKESYNVLSSDQTSGACYIQGYTGVGTKIKFPFIDNFRSSIVGKILINRADLVIKPSVADLTKLPPPFLMAYELDDQDSVQIALTTTGLALYLQGESSLGILGASNPLLIQYNTTSNEYRIVMTSYIQALIDKNINLPNNGLMLIGTNDIQAAGSNYYYANINRLIFYNDKSNPYNIKLNVHYSEYK